MKLAYFFGWLNVAFVFRERISQIFMAISGLAHLQKLNMYKCKTGTRQNVNRKAI